VTERRGVQDAYYDYLHAYLKYVLNKNDYAAIMADGVKGLNVTASSIVLQSKYDDFASIVITNTSSREAIEDASSWAVAKFPEILTFSKFESANETSYVYFGDTVDYTTAVKGWPQYHDIKAFHAVGRYDDGMSSFIYGYVEVDRDIKLDVDELETQSKYMPEMTETRELLKTVLPHNDNTIVTDKRYPMVLVSVDGGANYEIVNVPEDSTAGVPKVTEVDSGFDGKYFNASYKDGDELYITLMGVNNQLAPNGLKFVKEGGTYIYLGVNGPTWSTIPQTAKELAERAIDGIEVLMRDTCIVTLDKQGNYVYIQPPSAFSVTNGKVTAINGNSIVVSGVPPASSGQEVRLLLSMRTAADVVDQTEFLRFDDSYLSSRGLLKVRTLETTTSRNADRVYSPREAMSMTERQTTLAGIAAISEDTNHKVYDWYQAVDADNTVSWVYEYMTNAYGNYVYYADETGIYVETLDTDRVNNFVMLEVQLKNGIKVADAFNKAAALIGDVSEIVLEDPEYSSYIQSLIDDKRANEIIYLKANNIGSVAMAVFGGDTDYFTKIDDISANLDFYQNTPEDKILLNEKIFEQDGPYGSINNPYESFGHRVALVHIGRSQVLFDKMLQTIRVKGDIDLAFTLSVPYHTRDPMTSFVSYDLQMNDTVALDVEGYPITSIFIPPKGYGGYTNNASWNNTLPWFSDPDAFTNESLTNTLGEEIYLADKTGARLMSEYGSYRPTMGTVFTLEYKDVNVVREIVLELDGKTLKKNVYALDVPKIEFYASKDVLDSSNVNDTITFYPVVDGMDVTNHDLNYNPNCFWEIGAFVDGNWIPAVQNPDVWDSYIFTGVYEGLRWYKATKNLAFLSDEPPSYNAAKIAFRIKNTDQYVEFEVKMNGQIANTDYPNTSVLDVPVFKMLFDRNSTTTIENVNIAIVTKSLVVSYLAFSNGATSITSTSEYGTFVELIRDYAGNVTAHVEGQVIPKSIVFDNVGDLEGESIKIQSWILEYDNSTTVEIERNRMLVSGVKGNVIMKAPKFESFRTMREDLGGILHITRDPIYSYSPTHDLLKFYSTEGSRVTFETLFSEVASGIETDIEYLELKVLPTKSAGLNVNVMNNPAHYLEITTEADRKKFGFDRIYFNPNGIPQPVVRIGISVLNPGNERYFFKDEDYKTQDNSPVYECNAEGKYIGYRKIGSAISQYVLGNDRGDLVEHVTSTMDKRFQPRKPKYDTCYEWFLNEFYVHETPKSPFTQTLIVTDTYDVQSSSWEQLVEIRKWEKSGNSMILMPVPDEETYFLIKRSSKSSIDKGTRVQDRDIVLFDATNSRLKFMMSLNDLHWDYRTKYGVIIRNMKTTKYQTDINIEYETGSTRNVADPFDKDSSIVQVNEFALLDKYKRTIAYADFPPIEYRTDSQHLSFLAVIGYEFLISHPSETQGETNELSTRDENEWSQPVL
jgi:hypothetical protein